MNPSYLLVPVRLDALRLETAQTVVEAMADFSELPWSDGARDHNPTTPYLSEAILADAFENENLTLAAGVHLHWALPDALTVQGADGFPAVPNRWLVTREYDRRSDDGSSVERVTDRWVVESDYLHPDGEGASEGAVSVPVDPDASAGRPRPYRYLGRAVPYALWSESAGGGTDEFATPLTAAGYGEPAFAAFYPNCASVFGFWDGELADQDPADLALVYSVVGWYADSGVDPVAALAAGLLDEQTGEVGAETLRAALEDEHEWTFDAAEEDPAVTSLACLCFGRIDFAPDADAAAVTAEGVEVSIGSTPTEALAAHLARRIVEENGDAGYTGDDRSTLEEQLEALTLEDGALEAEVDTGASFPRVRHEKEFTAVSAGSLWDVRLRTAASAPASADSASADTALSGDVAAALNRLNEAQRRYNDALDELEGRRRLLFADWYRYLLCAYPMEDQTGDYPDIDEVRRFLLECGVRPISRLEKSTGTVVVTPESSGDEGWIAAIGAAEGDGSASLAARVAAAADDLFAALRELDPAGTTFGVREVPAPRYWRANDPVVLLTGSTAVRASERYGKDSDGVDGVYLACRLESDAEGAYGSARALASALGPDDLAGYGIAAALNTWTGQPWNPILLDWQLRFFPLRSGSSVANGRADYDPSCVLDSYELAVDEPDLTALGSDPEVMTGASVYEGTAILTDSAGSSLQDRVTDYCVAQLGASYEEYLALQGTSAAVDADYLASQEAVRALQGWYLEVEGNEKSPDDPVWTALLALEILTDPDFHCLSQALGGFTEALVMQKQTLQLSVRDPLGFAPFQEFAALVADAVGDCIERAPQPLSDYNALRAGCIEPLNLRLIDSFGRYLDLDWDRVTCAEKLTCSWDGGKVHLPPRIAEPARLGFRWISADGGVEEHTPSTPASPVCGWLLTNHLENSVVVYDAAGTMLGSVILDADQGYWADAPGSLSPVSSPDGISNARLRAVVEEVIARTATDEAYLGAFIGALDSACDAIEPESASQVQGLSLLVGRPLAVVRAAVSLETQGLPEYDQSWTQFRVDLVTGERESHGIEAVEFPVRIGEDSQLNDGLAAYWVEDEDGAISASPCYSLQGDAIDDDALSHEPSEPFVTRHAEGDGDADFNLRLRFDGAPKHLTMLLDPRGVIHATCGALPARTLTLPPQHYADVVKKLEVTFLTAPVLTGRNQIRIPLAEEPGYTWSWLWLPSPGADWSEVSMEGVLRRAALEAEFPSTSYPTLWADLVAAGWLTSLLADEKAAIVPRDQRSGEPAGYDEPTLARVGDFLDRHRIGQPSPAPSFAERQVLREGWLKLTPQP